MLRAIPLLLLGAFACSGCIARPTAPAPAAGAAWAAVRELKIARMEVTVHGRDGDDTATVHQFRYLLPRDGAPAKLRLVLEAAGTERMVGFDGTRYWISKPQFAQFLSRESEEGAADVERIDDVMRCLDLLIQSNFAPIQFEKSFPSKDREGNPARVTATVSIEPSDLLHQIAPDSRAKEKVIRVAQRLQVRVNDTPWITAVIPGDIESGAVTVR